MAIWTLARKDLWLLLRDRRAVVILLAMPFIFILILGMLLGEVFGQKRDDRLRVSVVNLDRSKAGLKAGENWAQAVLKDLSETGEREEDQVAGIRIELIDSMEEAQQLIRHGKRPAVLVLGPAFSDKVSRCSFLADGINPFYREGVKLSEIDAVLLKDPTQEAAAAIIEQVAQVSLLRVVLPHMIGRAFEQLSEERFIDLLCREVHLPVAPKFRVIPAALGGIKTDADGKASLQEFLRVAAEDKPAVISDYKQRVGRGVQLALQQQFSKYNLTGKTWAALTKADPRHGTGTDITQYREDGRGVLKRGAIRYQELVPSYTVMFAFFLVLAVGWLFVSERRQGTLKRLLAAPLSRTEILLGKMVPCFLVSLAQGLILLAAGKVVFGMSWGPEPLWLLPVVVTTSLAAIGLALVVATLARTEAQVAIYGTLLVVVLAGVSGCLMPRALMPEDMQLVRKFTPHAWALDAYNQLLANPTPDYGVVGQACLVLAGFGTSFIALAWGALRLE